MEKTLKKYVSILCAVLMLLVFLLPSASSAPAQANSIGEVNFDNTNVLDDLLSSTVEGKPFVLADYPFDATGLYKQPQILSFIEYAYTFRVNMQQYYGLYVYFYNPQGLMLDAFNAGNKIQLATEYNALGKPSNYSKFDLRFCSVSTDKGSENLFYKFKVMDPQNDILSRINTEIMKQQSAGTNIEECTRRYDVSGVELAEKGKPNAFDYFSATYMYNGFAKGCGPNREAESTLGSKVNELETIKLTPQSTVFRTPSSDQGLNYQTDLNSVWFSLDNRFLIDYGKLQKIKAEWYEYKTQPAVVSPDKNLIDALLPFMGKNIGQHTDDLAYKLYYGQFSGGNDLGGRWTSYDWSYNIKAVKGGIWGEGFLEDTINVLNPCTQLFFSLKSDDEFFVPPKRVADYIYNYNQSYNTGKLPIKSKQISADLFLDGGKTVDAGRTAGYNKDRELDNENAFDWFNMPSYDSNHDSWQKFRDYGFNPPKNTDETYGAIKPIQEVTSEDLYGSDESASKELLINKNDVGRLRTDYNEAQIKSSDYPFGRTVFLFRFATTDYWSKAISYYPNGGKVVEGNAYLAQQTIFLDFDIIQLTFNKDGVFTVIAAVSNPIDIINGFTPPTTGMRTDKGCNGWSWLIIVVITIILLILFFVLLINAPIVLVGIGKVLWWVIKVVGYIIASPVLLTVFIVKKVKARQAAKTRYPKPAAASVAPTRDYLVIKMDQAPAGSQRPRKKVGWADTKAYPHARHPAYYKKGGKDAVDYVTFTHSKEVDLDGKKVRAIPLNTNINKSGKDKRVTHVVENVYKGKRSALGKEQTKYRLTAGDKKTVEKVFKSAPKVNVPTTGGTKQRIRQKEKPRKK